MQKFIECTGKTEEAAIAAALDKLNLAREDVSVEVLEPGFLGIGGTPAKVKVSYEAPDEPEEVPAPTAEEQPAPAVKETAAPEEEKEEAWSAAPATAAAADDEIAGRITGFLTGLLEQMEVKAAPQVSVDAEGNYLVELVGDGLGSVIGRRGEPPHPDPHRRRGLPLQAGGVPGAHGPPHGGEGGSVPPERDAGAHERL